MKRKSLLFLLLIALFVPWAANAQETVTIGDGTSTDYYTPIGTYYNYSITEQLYTADEIGMEGTIESISFQYASSTVKDIPITVYMMHTNAENLATGISLADADVVFEGTYSVTGSGWMTITLDTPFEYDGTSNLLIGINKGYLYYYSGNTWYHTTTNAVMARYTQSDSAGPYTTSTIPGTTRTARPNIQLVITPASSDCPKPANLVASNVTAHTADLTWESEATQFMLQYKKVSDESWNSVYLEDEGTSYQLTNLVAETEYNVRVAAHIESCGSDPQTGDDIYSDWREIEFTTGIACPAPTNLAVTDGSITAREATVTWEGTSNSYVVMIGEENLAVSADFETGDLSQANFTTTTSYPFTVVANTHSGSYCAKSGNGDVNSSTSDMVLEVTLSADATLSFSAKVSSEASWDKAYFSIDGTNKINAISGNGNWIDYSYPLTAGTHTLRWYYTKDSSTSSNDDCFYVDDIVVSAGVDSWTEYTTNAQTYTFTNLTPNRSYLVKVKGNCGDEGYSQATAPVSFTTLESCVMPTGLTASDVTAHEATISWTSAANAWQICVNDDEENLIDVTETTYNFTGLAPETTYTVKVRTNCGNEYSDWTNNMSFTTDVACPAPTGFAAMPNSITAHTANLTWQGTSNSYQVAYRTAAYTDGIEEGFGSTVPEGWTRYNTLLTDDVLNGTTALTPYTSGWSVGTSNGVFDSHARVNIYSTGCKYWLVTPTLTVPAGAAFSFDLALTAYSGSNVPAPSTTGTDDRFIVLVSTDEMATWTILREWNNSGSEYVYNNIANTATGENVSFDFSAYAGQTVYVAFYGESTVSNADNNLHIDNVNIGLPVAAGEWQYMTEVTEVPCQLTGLLAERKYEATLQGDCEDEGVSAVVGPITFTTDVACPAPTGLTASDVTAHEATISWTSAADAWQICVNNDEENLIDVTETTYNFTGLAPETAYTVKVRTNCGDDGYSDWTNNVTFTTEEVCPMDINNVTVNYITNNEATVAWEGTHDNYQVQYRTAETSQIVVSEGSFADDFENGLDNWTIYQEGEAGGNWSIINPATFSGSYSAHSGSYVAMARSWSGSAFNADNWLVSPQVTIPDSMSYWMMGDATYPETYDICVSITGNAVADFTSVVTYNTNPDDWTLVTVDLSAYAGQTGYIAFHQYGYDADYLWIDDVNIGGETVITPAGEWMTVETTGHAAELTGLAPGTPYEYQVRGYCADEDTWSNWTNMASFNTLDVCATPENLVIVPGAESATLTWSGVQDEYEVLWIKYAEYTAGNFDNLQQETVTGTIYEITGLESGVAYLVDVIGICSETQVSDNLVGTFTTALLWTDPETWSQVPDYNGDPEQTSAPEVINVPENMTVVIPENTVVTVNQIDLPANSEIIIENGGELAYTVDDPTDPNAAAQGIEVAMSMNIEAPTRNNSGYRLIASPIYQTIDVVDCGLTENYYGMDLYSFDASYPGAEWRNYKTNDNFSDLEIGKGYLYYNSESVFVTFYGQTVPSNVIYPINLAWNENVQDNSWKGLNLVGNPFTCKATPKDQNLQNKSFFVLNDAGDEVITTPSSASYVAPMKGFFVVADGPGDVCNVTRYTGSTKSALNMTVNQNDDLVDVAVVNFNKGENLPKVQLNPNHTKVYMPVEGKDYAVATAESNAGEMPVNFKAEHNGSYTLNFDIDNVNFNYLHLIDNMTGADVDLLAAPYYTFSANSTDYASRFKLVYATGDNSNDDNFAFFNNGNIIINNDGEATLQVVDVMGRILKSESINGSTSVNLNVAPGVYMLRLINGNDVKVQKIVVR